MAPLDLTEYGKVDTPYVASVSRPSNPWEWSGAASWIEGSDLTGAHGAAIATWSDRVSGSYSASGGQEPDVDTSTVPGLRVASFVAANLDVTTRLDASTVGTVAAGDRASFVRFLANAPTAAAQIVAILGRVGVTSRETIQITNTTFVYSRLGTGGTTNVTYASVPAANTWYSVGVNWRASDGATEVFFNGISVQTGTNTRVFASTPDRFGLGRRIDTTSSAFDGKVALASWYSRLLTAQEHQTLHDYSLVYA